MITKFKSLTFGFVLAIAGATQASADVVLRYAEAGPNRGTRAAAVQFYADEVERLSGGDIKVDIHWGGALLKWSGVMSGVSAGSADLGSVLSSYEPQELKALGIGDIPLEYADPWVGMRAMYELMTTESQLQESLAGQSLVYLSNFSTTGVQFECTEGNQIRTVDDIKGKRVRATGTYTNVLAELGADTVSMTFGEVYQALDTGLVDCLASYFYTMKAYKTYEVVETVTRVDWGQLLGFAIVINEFAWSDLNEEQQTIMLKAGSNMIDHFARLTIEDAEKVAKTLANGGFGKVVPVTPMAPEERKKILEATLPFRDSWIEDANRRGMDGQRIWDTYIGLLEQYQSEFEANGYPWQN
ncbi:MAG: C4-dicarboxylate TRAP transporter substrate-binding protein [Marinobacter sp.]|uniref:C4-dicarboxylate TRAP transporter substrate-binding protein n=1 Tax=Marinobacter sp. TaxID=50741 RepID=UPI003297BC13